MRRHARGGGDWPDADQSSAGCRGRRRLSGGAAGDLEVPVGKRRHPRRRPDLGLSRGISRSSGMGTTTISPTGTRCSPNSRVGYAGSPHQWLPLARVSRTTSRLSRRRGRCKRPGPDFSRSREPPLSEGAERVVVEALGPLPTGSFILCGGREAAVVERGTGWISQPVSVRDLDSLEIDAPGPGTVAPSLQTVPAADPQSRRSASGGRSARPRASRRAEVARRSGAERARNGPPESARPTTSELVMGIDDPRSPRSE